MDKLRKIVRNVVSEVLNESTQEIDYYEILINKVPIAEVVDGKKIYETVTTKEIANILGVSTKKAYEIMSRLENEKKAGKVGYKTKFGWEDPENSNLKTTSLTWEILS